MTEMIPDEAIEAAARAIHRHVERGTEWETTTQRQRMLRIEEGRAALEAALSASPIVMHNYDAHPAEENAVLAHKPITADELDSYMRGARPADQELAVLVPVHVVARAVAALREVQVEEAEWTTEPDITWPGDLHPRSRVRASRELIREANAVRDLDGSGIVGRLADMLAGWLLAPAEETEREHRR